MTVVTVEVTVPSDTVRVHCCGWYWHCDAGVPATKLEPFQYRTEEFVTVNFPGRLNCGATGVDVVQFVEFLNRSFEAF